MKHCVSLIAACLSLTVSTGASPRAAQGNDSRTIFVAVIDKGGKPIKALSIADFSVTEDGAPKTVLSVEPAGGPLSVALLVDRFGQDSTFNVLDVRAALATIVKTLHAANPDTEISVTTIDPAAVPQIPFTMSSVEILKFVDRQAPGVDQSVLLEGIVSASRSMARAKNPRRAIFAVVAGYKQEGNPPEMDLVAAELKQSGASLWVLEGRSPFGGGYVALPREAALTFAVPRSGGARSAVSVGTALETQAKKLTEQLASQYAVTYGAPSGAAKVLAVSAGGKDVKVIAPTWIAR
jgi:hypothetical protein